MNKLVFLTIKSKNFPFMRLFVMCVGLSVEAIDVKKLILVSCTNHKSDCGPWKKALVQLIPQFGGFLVFNDSCRQG